MLSAALHATLSTSFPVLLVMLCATLAMLFVGLAMALAMLLTMGLSATTSRFRSGSFNSCNNCFYRGI